MVPNVARQQQTHAPRRMLAAGLLQTSSEIELATIVWTKSQPHIHWR